MRTTLYTLMLIVMAIVIFMITAAPYHWKPWW